MTINSNTQYIPIASNNKSSEKGIIIDPRIEKARRVQMKNEYYAKEVEEDKKFANPRQHIHHKYSSKHSPYYIEGLTDAERFAAEINESRYLKLGENRGLYHNDPLFRGMERLYGDVFDAQLKAFQRQETSTKFGQLLKDNNITIPQDTKLRFTIDPYSYKLNVSGTEDSNLAKSIEDVFNTAGNAKQLYYHIMATDLYDNTQFSPEKNDKRSLYYEIKDKTGYDLRDLTVVDGKFVTEDGTDIFEIYEKSIRDGTSVPERYKVDALGYHGELLFNLAKKGFDSVEDLILSIDYENGSYYDVGQSKNFGKGQTDWIDELRAFRIQKQLEIGTVNTKVYTKEEHSKNVNEIISEAFKNILKDEDMAFIKNESETFNKVELLLKYLFGIEEELWVDDFNSIIEKLEKNELLSSENFRTEKTDWVDTYA